MIAWDDLQWLLVGSGFPAWRHCSPVNFISAHTPTHWNNTTPGPPPHNINAVVPAGIAYMHSTAVLRLLALLEVR